MPVCSRQGKGRQTDTEQGPAKHGALRPSWEDMLVHLLCPLPGTSSPNRLMLLELSQRRMYLSDVGHFLGYVVLTCQRQMKPSCENGPQLAWSVHVPKLCPSEMVLSKDTLGLLLAVLPASRHAGFIRKICPPSPACWGEWSHFS